MELANLEGQSVEIAGELVTLEEELGSGAEGAVFSLGEDSSRVAKIFKQDKRDDKVPKIKAMIENPPDDPTLEAKGVHSIVWPLDPVRTPADGAAVGYTMPHLDLEAQQNAVKYARTELSWAETTLDKRLKTAYNLALVVNAVHAQNHAIGDFNHQNILINDGFVSLIDCDGFEIRGNDAVYTGQTYFGRYNPPEGRGESLRDVQYADRFGLAVHIFQLLMECFHPYQAQGSAVVGGSYADWTQEHEFPYEARRPGELEPAEHAPDYSQLPATIRDAFSDVFYYGKQRPRRRPSSSDWVSLLADAGDIANHQSSNNRGSGVASTDTEPSTSAGDPPTGEAQSRSTPGHQSKGDAGGATTDTSGSRRDGEAINSGVASTGSPGRSSASPGGGATSSNDSANDAGHTTTERDRLPNRSSSGGNTNRLPRVVQSKMRRFLYYLLGAALLGFLAIALVQL